MPTEQQIQQQIRLDFGTHPDIRLFRNNTGNAWAGNAQHITRPVTVALQPGDVLIRNARPLRAGLAKGSSDLIGWRAITVTEADIGRRLAVFSALEVKTPTGRIQPEQQQFLNVVQRFGGIGAVVRSPDDARRALLD